MRPEGSLPCSQESAVVTVWQTYELEEWCSISGRGRNFFSSSPLPDWFWDPPSLLFSEYRELFPRRQSGRGVKVTTNLHLASRLSYTSTPPYVFMAWYLVKHRDNFTFTTFSLRLHPLLLLSPNLELKFYLGIVVTSPPNLLLKSFITSK
jgi:hypothetical protein